MNAVRPPALLCPFLPLPLKAGSVSVLSEWLLTPLPALAGVWSADPFALPEAAALTVGREEQP